MKNLAYKSVQTDIFTVELKNYNPFKDGQHPPREKNYPSDEPSPDHPDKIAFDGLVLSKIKKLASNFFTLRTLFSEVSY